MVTAYNKKLRQTPFSDTNLSQDPILPVSPNNADLETVYKLKTTLNIGNHSNGIDLLGEFGYLESLSAIIGRRDIYRTVKDIGNIRKLAIVSKIPSRLYWNVEQIEKDPV